MQRRMPWFVLSAGVPAAVLIVGGFLGVTPFGFEMFLGGVALLAAADITERRVRMST